MKKRCKDTYYYEDNIVTRKTARVRNAFRDKNGDNVTTGNKGKYYHGRDNWGLHHHRSHQMVVETWESTNDNPAAEDIISDTYTMTDIHRDNTVMNHSWGKKYHGCSAV